MGLIVRVGASTGETDGLALVLNRWVHVSEAVLLYIGFPRPLVSRAFFSDSEQIFVWHTCAAVLQYANNLNRSHADGKTKIQ